MSKSKKIVIAARKRPLQARSAQLVEDLLEAAIRVLSREGAQGFTTVAMAAEAGVSVGSLYQYFPSKESILFRLQADEWEETWSVLDEILAEDGLAPLDRLRKMVLVFFRSERQEAALRTALDDAGALTRDTPEARALTKKTRARMAAFFEELLPHTPIEERALAADVVMTSMGATAEKLTARHADRRKVEAWASACADMYCSYLRSLEHRCT